MKRHEVCILKNLSRTEIEGMLDDGWALNSIAVLPYSNYYGVVSHNTIEKEYYFIKEIIIGVDYAKYTHSENNISREL